MPRVPKKSRKPGRNDPCWCGSGKKYKDCHLPLEEAWRSDQRMLRTAYETLLPHLLEAAENLPAPVSAAAFRRFWQDTYTLEQMLDLDEMEDRGSQRFISWLVFDYPLGEEPDPTATLVGRLVADPQSLADFEPDPYQQQLLARWQHVRLRPYHVVAVQKGRSMLVRDMFTHRLHTLADQSAARRVAAGEVLVGQLLPVEEKAYRPDPPPASDTRQVDEDEVDEPDEADEPDNMIYHVVGAIAHLTSDTGEKLLDYANIHLEALRREQPDATVEDLIRQQSDVFNHFVMQLPEEHNPSLLDDMLLRTRTALQLSGIALGSKGDDGDTPAEPAEPEHAEDEPAEKG